MNVTTYSTHGLSYTFLDLQEVQKHVRAGLQAGEAVARVLPEIAAIPGACRAVINNARHGGLIRFDRMAQTWVATEGAQEPAPRGRRPIGEKMISRSVYVFEDVWERFRALHGGDGARVQSRIRELLAAELAN